mmetsp:Transcript_37505/g.81714  ORF Transcript_37505/g.81714 Transcript_37505/m.81714 type:complete len:310 (+) Transcript_37505:318-1247(+)
MKYSRDGDQLCSNIALIFAFIATVLVIVPQSTCSFLSINPAEIVKMPDVWPPEHIAILFPNISNSTMMDMINNGTIDLTHNDSMAAVNESPSKRRRRQQQQEQQQQEQQQERMLRKLVEEEVYPSGGGVPVSTHQRSVLEGSIIDELFPTTGGTARNITATRYTINLGPWLVGSYQIDGKCYKMDAIDRAPPPEPSLLASRAMGIIAAVSGFAGFVAAMFNLGADDETRRRRNRYIAVLYSLAAVSTWLTFLIANMSACKGAERTWYAGALEGLVLKYDSCQCRAGCFLTITAGCSFIISVICVLTYSG